MGGCGGFRGRQCCECVQLLAAAALCRGALAALQRFSESTLEYLANLDQAPDPTVRKDAFATDTLSAYDILFHQWLQSREAKVRLRVP